MAKSEALARGTATDVMKMLPKGMDVPAMLTTMETMWSAMSEYQRELAGLMASRVEKDTEAFREALACRTMSDALSLQTRWVEGAMKDYGAGTGKMMSLYSKISSEAVQKAPTLS
ncbi:MAG: phasin family protein [Microvirga sp.]